EIDVDYYRDRRAGDGRGDKRFPSCRSSNESGFGVGKLIKLRRSHQNNLQSARLVRSNRRDRFQLKFGRTTEQLFSLFGGRIATRSLSRFFSNDEFARSGKTLQFYLSLT